jgi:hypothetical protein
VAKLFPFSLALVGVGVGGGIFAIVDGGFGFDVCGGGRDSRRATLTGSSRICLARLISELSGGTLLSRFLCWPDRLSRSALMIKNMTDPTNHMMIHITARIETTIVANAAIRMERFLS